ncbi:C40 family peptidase [Ammoniphilus sp. 3BR4]|uniref:C40 family peptidase n=1 Tax=Ammoniphilus sp. 3BR4 TaxID=3158265 RepID=UPI0034673210
MKRLGIVFLLFVLMAGCGINDQGFQANHEKTRRMDEVVTNDLGTNPDILEDDRLVRIGDLGVENEFQHKASINNTEIMESRVPPQAAVNPAIQPLPGGYVENVISMGVLFLGTPYEYGSDRDTPTTFDCSDFTRWAYLAALGLDLPSDSRSQAEYIDVYSPRKVWSLYDAKRGDLLFFMSYRGPREENYAGINKADQRITHCGIYLGDGKILHTMSEKTGGVRIDDVFDRHLEWRFIKGGSVLP